MFTILKETAMSSTLHMAMLNTCKEQKIMELSKYF